jgi:protein ImuB
MVRTCVRIVIICVLLPRFELVVAAGGREALLGEPAALAPEPGREQMIGEVSLAAEAFGVRRGMRLGEALARCGRLALVPPDPVGVTEAWDAALERLEGMGAAVESARPGLACFAADGLLRLHGRLEGVLEAARDALRARSITPRLGAGPTRFLAVAAASRARARRAEIVSDAAELADEPIGLLALREDTAALTEPLERLGIATLGELAAVPRAAIADRFGRPGLLAHALVRGSDTPLRPRLPGERLEEVLELPEAGSGEQLERALGMLADRVLARRERRGRTLRAVVLSARLVEGGTWRDRVVFREALADPVRMRLALAGHLAQLPAPAETLRLAVDRFGPPHATGRALFDDDHAARRARLAEAVRQARAAAGPDAALRVLEIDPGSRVPERRAVLAPFVISGPET